MTKKAKQFDPKLDISLSRKLNTQKKKRTAKKKAKKKKRKKKK